MGFKKKVKKATHTVKKVANTPVVKTAVTAVATTVGGQQGAQMVDQSYDVMNNGSPTDILLGTISPSYLITKSKIDSFKGESSPLSVLIPASSNVGDFADKSISYTGISKGLLQTANGINNTVKSAQGKRKGLIAEILSWFGF